jgi:hypothetical protein
LGGIETEAGQGFGFPAPGQEITIYPFGVSLTDDPKTIQDVPNEDQQFASNSHDGFAATNTLGQALELVLPTWVEKNRNLSGFDQSGP